jgi:hypothetical protein
VLFARIFIEIFVGYRSNFAIERVHNKAPYKVEAINRHEQHEKDTFGRDQKLD